MLRVRPRAGGDSPVRGRSGSCRNWWKWLVGESGRGRFLADRHHVVGVRQDALDQSRATLKGIALFSEVGIPVVGPPDSPDLVRGAALGDVWLNLRAAQQA